MLPRSCWTPDKVNKTKQTYVVGRVSVLHQLISIHHTPAVTRMSGNESQTHMVESQNLYAAVHIHTP